MKQLSGTVIHTKMLKTAVVEVVRRWTHPLYRKTLTKRKKYLAHLTDKRKLAAGDKVVIQETRPISKRKKWRVVEKLATTQEADTSEVKARKPAKKV